MQATLRLYTAMHRTLLLNSTGNRLRSVMLAKGGIFGQMMSPRLLRLGLLAIVRRACSSTSFRRLDRASCSSLETLHAVSAASMQMCSGSGGAPCARRAWHALSQKTPKQDFSQREYSACVCG